MFGVAAGCSYFRSLPFLPLRGRSGRNLRHFLPEGERTGIRSPGRRWYFLNSSRSARLVTVA
jgi:hypothetical protein